MKKSHLPPANAKADIKPFLKRLLDGPVPQGEQMFSWIGNRASAMSAFAGVVTITNAIMEKLRSEGRHINLLTLAANVCAAAIPDNAPEQIPARPNKYRCIHHVRKAFR